MTVARLAEELSHEELLNWLAFYEFKKDKEQEAEMASSAQNNLQKAKALR